MKLLKDLLETRLRRDDEEFDLYAQDQELEKQDQARDAIENGPWYVAWSGQSYEFYGEDPANNDGRYKPKGDGGRIVAINMKKADAEKLAAHLDEQYENKTFPDESVYGRFGKDWYIVEYHGAYAKSMTELDEADIEMMKHYNPKDYGHK